MPVPPAQPTSQPTPSLATVVARTLARHVSDVVGVMGNGNAHLIDALVREAGVRYTPVRHEAGAVVAADAYYRASGRIAAATATYGAGFTNTVTALAEAAQARTPLLLLAGEAPTSGHRPWDVDQIALASAVGVRTYTVGRADAAGTVVLAVEHALAHRTPAVLALPYDVVTAPVATPVPPPVTGAVPDVASPEPRLPPPLVPDGARAHAQLLRFARLLSRARRPLLLAGRGAWLSGAGPALSELAAELGALTTTSILGRGIFADAATDLGVAGGFGADGSMALARDADVVLVVGAGLNVFTTRFGDLVGPEATVLQVDLAPTATHPFVDSYVRADARVAIEELVRLVRREITRTTASTGPRGDARSAWRTPREVAVARTYPPGDALAPDGRLDPRSAAARLARLLPTDRVVVSDGGHFIGWAAMHWPVAAPDRMVLVGTTFQAIGLGLPSMVGAALARPEATIVLTTGDGGALMALADLESAVRVARGRGLAVVWNDAAYGAEVHVYGRQGLTREPMLIPEVDFAAMAAAVGARGVVVRTLADLEVLAQWRDQPAHERDFMLLDLRISPRVVAPYQEEILQRAAR